MGMMGVKDALRARRRSPLNEGDFGCFTDLVMMEKGEGSDRGQLERYLRVAIKQAIDEVLQEWGVGIVMAISKTVLYVENYPRIMRIYTPVPRGRD